MFDFEIVPIVWYYFAFHFILFKFYSLKILIFDLLIGVNRVCNVSHGMSTLSNACYTMGKGLLFNLNRTSWQLHHGVNRFLFYIDEVRSIPDQHGEHNFYSDSCRHVNLVGRHYHDT